MEHREHILLSALKPGTFPFFPIHLNGLHGWRRFPLFVLKDNPVILLQHVFIEPQVVMEMGMLL
jgi:hypothetical protein